MSGSVNVRDVNGAHPRESRRYAEVETSQHRDTEQMSSGRLGEIHEYRVDLERLRFSPYFGRLSAVTQVMPQTGVGPVLHNRLTHSLKVSAVARVIAARLAGHVAQHQEFERGESAEDSAVGATLARLGGCDTIVAQAAAHAHDLGHPPFGHLGERVLDRIARTRLGLPEGFEGNAQTFRIMTRLDTLGRSFPGLNLTAAVRASVLKYPWTRDEWVGDERAAVPAPLRPRGVGGSPETGADKFSAYATESAEMRDALAAYPNVAPGLQTVECAVMDLADDIAYAVHDLDDYTRAGVLQQAEVAGELHTWLRNSVELAEVDQLDVWRPGHSLELRWRHMHERDAWIADRDTFHAAVRKVSAELADDLLATPYDGGITSERAMSGFTRRWIERLRSSVVVDEHPHIRSGHVRLERQAWHEVAVLKFVHARFVLERADLAQAQRGQAQVVEGLVMGFNSWLADPVDAPRAPRRLLEWVDVAREQLFELGATDPKRQGTSRAILDFVSSFTDQQAVASFASMTGASAS